MYEDIEIMRRLLDAKLQTTTSFFRLTAACASCHIPENVKGFWLDPLHSWPSQKSKFSILDVGPSHAIWNELGYQANLGHHNLNVHPGLIWETQPTGLEGVYLKGQGVVYTLTLPPPQDDPKPTVAKPASKPLTDWERVRKELRGEKVEEATPSQKPKAPSVADTILKVLADNGHNFSHLSAKESLTVVVTFRKVNTTIFNPHHPTLSNTKLFLLGLEAAGVELSPKTEKPSKKGGQTDKDVRESAAKALEFLGKEVSGKSSPANDHELLGDLHLKQNRVQDAIKAYEKALEHKPSGKQAEALYRKIAQAYLTLAERAKSDAQYQQVIDKAIQWLKRVQDEKHKKGDPDTPPPVTSPRLPAKLIISVSKQLLDQVGSGKISFEEFKQAVSVEYLTFPAAAKTPEAKKGG
jgi:hypothetical protein